NIKNARVHALVREAARRSGKSQTSVVEEALARFLDAMERPSSCDDRLTKALDIAADFDRRLSAAERTRMSTVGLYDDRGLPA
nr:type II toxin-antitoxin system VapB family antitoxin [Nocardioidaceae bacterium]